MRYAQPSNHRRAAVIGTIILLMLPVIAALVYFAWNAQVLNDLHAAQETTVDASSLAASQSLVDDRMLDGTPQMLSDLEDLARQVALQSAVYNPLGSATGPPTTLTYLDGDITFTRIANPLDGTLQLTDTVSVTGRRSQATGNAVPAVGSRLFGGASFDIVTTSTTTLDRRVAGLRPIFAKNVPLAPIALSATEWTKQAEGASPPTTFTTTLEPPHAVVLRIGTSSTQDVADQLRFGVAPGQLTFFFGQFVLDPTNGLDVSIAGTIDPADLATALEDMKDDGRPRVWPLYGSSGGGDATVVRLVAARVTDVTATSGAMATKVSITLRPAFFSSPMVVTEAGRGINPYLCRVHRAP
jgi:hypothetical protein